MKIAMVDLETSSLKGDFGVCLVGGIKELGRRPTIFRIDEISPDDYSRDGKICRMIRDEIEKYDVVVTWYGAKFDMPFLRTRLADWNIRALKPIKHIDLYYTSRYRYKFHSNRLEAVAQFFGIKIPKTPLIGRIWTKAMNGQKPAMNYIARHCANDVSILEQVYLQMKDEIRIIKTR